MALRVQKPPVPDKERCHICTLRLEPSEDGEGIMVVGCTELANSNLAATEPVLIIYPSGVVRCNQRMDLCFENEPGTKMIKDITPKKGGEQT